MTRPSSAVKPIVVSRLRPCRRAQRLAPLPRCATTVRPAAWAGREFGQFAGDVLVGQAVEAIFPDAFRLEPARDRVAAYRRCERVVEGGVETADLQQPRPQRQEGADRRQAARLMQRGQRCQPVDRRDRGGVEADRTRKLPAAMDDPVTDAGQRVAAEMILGPIQQGAEQRPVRRFAAPAPVLEHLAARSLDDQPGRRAEVVHGPLGEEARRRVHRLEQPEFDAGRAGVEGEDRIGHVEAFRRSMMRASPRRRSGSAWARPGRRSRASSRHRPRRRIRDRAACPGPPASRSRRRAGEVRRPSVAAMAN